MNRITTDRFTMGLVAGITAAVAMNLMNLLTHNILHITDIHILDFASILIHGSIPHNLGETIFALGGQIGFAGVMGIAFAYLTKYIKTTNFMLKSVVFSLSIWFFTYATIILFNKINHINIETALSNLAATLVYAVVLALSLKRLDHKVLVNDMQNKYLTQRSLKYYLSPLPVRKKVKEKVNVKKPFKIR